MKKTIKVYKGLKEEEKEIVYIPLRYIVAVLVSIIEIILVISIVIILNIYLPYFNILILLTYILVILQIISSNENPDYKVPWLLFTIILPIIGFMLYFMFYKRTIPKHIIKRFDYLNSSLIYDDSNNLDLLKNKDLLIYSDAFLLKNLSNSHVYTNTSLKYYSDISIMHKDIIDELKKAKSFIFLEFFIIEEGVFWNSILEVLKEKVLENVEIKLIYDDIGCMTTLPSNYNKYLNKLGIETVIFSKLKGQANGEFNNRSHRKIIVIDGMISFTGGMNLADEYINLVNRFGHWKDSGIMIKGSAVNEFTKIFLMDFYMNKKLKEKIDFYKYYIYSNNIENGFVIPFGDGPKPLIDKQISKIAILNLLNHAKEYVYITTPYLIIDNEMMKTIENTALRGVDVRIIVPHIPDKKIVFSMTRENYKELINSNVKIYEYEKGFIHQKTYLVDGKMAIIGTINLDYRSLTHHFENGIWLYECDILKNIEEDVFKIIDESIYMNDFKFKKNFIKSFFKKLIKVFSPLL